MSAAIHYTEHEIDEVFDYFAADFKSPEGMEIRKVTPHYDPRKGTVLFAIYLEGDLPTSDLRPPTSDLDIPADDE